MLGFSEETIRKGLRIEHRPFAQVAVRDIVWLPDQASFGNSYLIVKAPFTESLTFHS